MEVIEEFLKKRGYNTISSDYYAQVESWKKWFSYTVDEFHKGYFFNGISNVTCDLKQLGMAKTVCEYWANLMMNERVRITVGNEEQNEKLLNVLNDNKFWKNANKLVELYCALGSGAFVEHLDDGKIRIDYVRADMIYPLSWNNRGITECAFTSRVHGNKEDYIYLQMHVLENGKYKVENHMFFIDGDNVGKEAPLPEDLEPEFNTGSEIPLFQIVCPNIVNNFDLNNPLGVSVYANALDVLEELDKSFDALNVEIETGRRMVFLASELFFSDDKGNMKNVVGQHETVLRYIGGMEGELIKDFSPAFRTADLQSAIQFQLNLLSEKVGMGTNTFEFTASGVKTATEVVSEDSDLYQNLKKHEINLREAIEGMIRAIEVLSQETDEKISVDEINVDFDDSIIQDKDAMRKQLREEVADGLRQPYEYRMLVFGEDEQTAKKMLEGFEEKEVIE